MNGEHPMDLFRLDGRVIMITGATGHLGAPIARAIAAAGGLPVLCGRVHATLGVLSDAINATGGSTMPLAFDVGDPEACAGAVAKVGARFGRLDGLVNCANSSRAATIETSTAQDFDIACRQNVTGPFTLIQEGFALLRAGAEHSAGGSSIVNIASMYGHVSPDPRVYQPNGKNNPPYYGAAKAALLQLTRYLAVYLGPQNIRVNSISPGPFPRPVICEAQPELHARLSGRTPLGRIGMPSELIGPVLFLLSPASSYVTGADLAVDGGWTAW